ncbi:MAG: aspartate/glutamate racemase family protein [Clostridia bacterium]|nr:aspartate/glutamate racemase family protein [Clostridia bacterium]
MNDKILGIIGGMGPEATVSFYSRIIKMTEVSKDQDHFRVVIDSNSKIPDRTDAILNNGPSPLPALIETAENVRKMGAVVAGIPCITAHYYMNELRKNTSLKVLSALEVLEDKIQKMYPHIKHIGVLATTGTVKSKLFNQQLNNHHILYPSDESQKKKVMEAIYGAEGIKNIGINKKSLNLLIAAGNELIEQGAELIIAGCTEIGVILNADHVNCPFLDPMDVLAEYMIND